MIIAWKRGIKHCYGCPYLDVSENSGTPKSSILIGFSIINHPFGEPLFLETPIWGKLFILTYTLLQVGHDHHLGTWIWWVGVCLCLIAPGQSPHHLPPFGMTTPGSTNIAGWKMDPDGRCISYWYLGIFQPAMLVYQRVISFLLFPSILCKSKIRSCCHCLRLVSRGWSPKTSWNARQILGGSMRMANFLAMSRDIAGARGRSYMWYTTTLAPQNYEKWRF